MRTVTNIFIVNLAVADFFVILFCLPPTVVWDVTETWFMGNAMCKIVLYFQVSIIYTQFVNYKIMCNVKELIIIFYYYIGIIMVYQINLIVHVFIAASV